MNKAKFIGWLLTFFIVSSFSFWYFIDSFNNVAISINEKELRTSIDATISGLTVKEFDANGVITNFLETPLIRHIPKNNTHYLVSPHIIINQENKSPWEIKSKEATAMYGGKEVTFSKDVVIIQKETKNTDGISVFTEEITYYPNDKYAITNKNVKLLQANNFIMATGIKAYLAESRVQLLSNARGHYEQKHG